MAAECSGAVELAEDDPAGALPFLRKAGQMWARASAPYDAARTASSGRALARLGDVDASRRELEARATASVDWVLALRRTPCPPCSRRPRSRPRATASVDWVLALRRTGVSSPLAPAASPAGLTAREVEVLRLVATGRTNPQIAAGLVLSEKTVARHLSNIFTKLEVGSRTAAAAYAYEHGLM